MRTLKSVLIYILVLGIGFGAGYIVRGKRLSTDYERSAPVKIASLLALTGPAAEYGEGMKRGLELAAKEVNASGGVSGRMIDLAIEDTQFQVPKALAAYQKLTSVDKISFFAGITGSRIAIPIAQATQDSNVVIVDALSSAPILSEFGGKTYFRVMPSDALAGKHNVGWAMEKGMKRPAIIFVEDDWGASYKKAVEQELTSANIAPAITLGISLGSKDFRTESQKIKSARPDTLFFLVYAKEGGMLLQQLRQIGVKSQVFGSDNLSATDFLAAGPAVVEGVLIALPAEPSSKEFQAFRDRFVSAYQKEPDTNAIKSYDALNTLVEAIRKGGATVEGVRGALHSPDFEYVGASGVIKFDEHGDLLHQEYARLTYHDGKLVPSNH